jgi:hypothetical protein
VRSAGARIHPSFFGFAVGEDNSFAALPEKLWRR